ncbi:MAG: hypothetical protein IKQ30_02830 [Bacteroidales bacterium]|nr:hypothetical protein [Bacteroidales bacterium]
MKKFLTLAAMLLVFGSSVASAQKDYANTNNSVIGHSTPRPHRSIRLHKQTVSYDEASTTLTVNFQSNSQGGTVEVYHDDEKVAGITANSGTTFSCILREYGEGNYNVIVSHGNTVMESKNYTVR